MPETFDLPVDRPYREERTYEGATYTYRIDREDYQAVKKAGAKMGSTLYSTLAAAYQLLVHRLADKEQVVVCIPSAGQNDTDRGENLVGHCVNFLPLKSVLDAKGTFPEFLKASKATLLEAMDNKGFTYGELIQNLDIERQPGRMPFLEVAFNVERMDYFGEWQDMDVRFEPNGKTYVHYTMFMNIVESNDGLRVDVDYNSEVLDQGTVEQWVKDFENIVKEIGVDPEKVNLASQHSSFTPVGEELIREWNKTGSDDSDVLMPVHRLFERQVKATPKSPALVTDHWITSYEELDGRACAAASALVRLGAKPGDRVAIISERSEDLIAVILGVLKLGGTYVPIDPAYPEDRVAFMLEDTAPAVLVIDRERSIDFDGPTEKVLNLVEGDSTFDSVEASADAPAYIMFTSGSTGNPKGVVVPHRGITRLVKGADFMKFGADQTFLLAAPVSFDASTLELWGALLKGGRLVGMGEGPRRWEGGGG
ncbi:MAG: AMP-binding protein, partial [Verrucomicrobiota bacterium]